MVTRVSSWDETIAREEIDRYFEDRCAEAEAAVEAAQAELNKRHALRAAWVDRSEIVAPPGPNPALALKMEISLITSHAGSRYLHAANKAIANRGDADLLAAAEDASVREKALRRWLTKQGYDLGALALPEPKTKRR